MWPGVPAPSRVRHAAVTDTCTSRTRVSEVSLFLYFTLSPESVVVVVIVVVVEACYLTFFLLIM